MSAARTHGAPTARAAQAAETRRRLVAVAVELFSDNSYDDVVVGDIAKSAGVAHGLVFHYFGSKRGIYAEAMREAARRLDELFAVTPGRRAGPQLRESLAAHLRYLAAHRGLALRLALGGRGADPEAWEVFEAGRWGIMTRLCVLFGLDPDNPALRMVVRAAMGFVDEATVYWLTHDEPYSVEVMVDYLVEVVSSAVQSAAALDPTLNLTASIQQLER
jgi:AcrR family transcriptional regulator